MLSDDAKAVLRYFWTTQPHDDDPGFILRAVQAGVHPRKFVDALIEQIDGETPQSIAIAQNMRENADEAVTFVAGVLGLT